MRRRTHYLEHNRNSKMPSNLIFVDTEANIYEHDELQFQTFRLGYAIHYRDDTRKSYPLHSIEDFYSLLDKAAHSNTLLYVFAHNMSYDYAILKLDSYISSRNLEITLRAIDSVFLVKAGSIFFISSTNFYRESLKKLGVMFGLSKMDSPDFSKVSDSKLMEYCQRDTEVLATIIKQHIDFISDNDLGSFKPTIAGQAFAAYRHRFMSHKLLVNDFLDILELARLSYRGGRCETFRMGDFQEIYKLDINSMYPFVMKMKPYPIKPFSTKPIIDCSLKDLLYSESFVMADCNITLYEPCIAVKREKLFFPIGNIRQVILQPEIDLLFNHPELGRIVKVNSMVSYDYANIFSDYVDFFYSLRCKSDNDAIKGMCKLFLNSLYGKFGQHYSKAPELITDESLIKMYSDIMESEHTFEIFDDAHSKIVKLGDVFYHVYQEKSDFAIESIPEIASSVTSYARCLLFEMMLIAGRENVLYCDTDSLFVSKHGFLNLFDAKMIDQTELGKLKLEEIGNVELFGAKDYVFNGKVKLKGVKHDAKKLPDGTYQQWQFQTKNIRYRNGTPDGTVILNLVTKNISRNYDKGLVCGRKVSPLVFDDF